MSGKIEAKSELPDSVEIPTKVLPMLQQLLSQKNIADMQFKTYAQGCFDSMGLDGDWNLDTNTWTFVHITKPKPQPEGGE